MKCICRNCRKIYDFAKSRADWQGYCSMKCQHERAKSLGCRDRNREYDVLKLFNAIGTLEVKND